MFVKIPTMDDYVRADRVDAVVAVDGILKIYLRDNSQPIELSYGVGPGGCERIRDSLVKKLERALCDRPRTSPLGPEVTL